MNILLALTALGSYLLYLHAIVHFFARPGGLDPRMNLLRWIGIASSFAHLWVFLRGPALPTLRGVFALALLALGLCLFFAARREVERSTVGDRLSIAFSGDLPTRLLRGGVYAWIRHPFYAAYLATWLAGVVAANTWVDVVLTASGTGVMAAMYVHAARQEEAKFARTPLGTDYADYRRVAGMFLPRVWRRPRTASDAVQQ